MEKRSILLACLGIALGGGQPAAQATQSLFRSLDVDSAFVDRKLHDNPVYRSIVYDQATDAALLITRQPGVNLNSNEPLIFPLEPTLNVKVQLHDSSSPQTGLAVWTGSIPDSSLGLDDPDNSILMVEHAKVLMGSLRYKGQLYQITPINEKIHAVVKVNEHRLQDASGLQPTTISNGNCSMDNLPTEIEINVLLVLTRQSKAALLDPVATFGLMLAEANQGFGRSQLPITLKSGGILSLSHNESPAQNTPDIMLDLLTKTSEGIGKEVLARRFSNAADQATLLFAKNSSTDSAKAVPSSAREDSLAVIKSAYATGTGLFARSIGRNLGAYHQLANAEQKPDFLNGQPRHPDSVAQDCDRTRLLVKAREMQDFFP
ncbi:hypothetical protein [Pseudomonas sp. DWP3-1-2]|uniref:hypothetical protein n=1 Tax=Pseudomonas sp. DWP3-1-2 TaxID=2804645 RepID=UPI003CF48CBD